MTDHGWISDALEPDLLTPVEELREGDLVDLERDPYADPDHYGKDGNDPDPFEFEYCEVLGTEFDPADEPLPGVRIEFDQTTVHFPHGHRVPKCPLRARE